MRFPRRSGVLLHITSLPSPFGIGDLGDEAFRFVDWLASAGQKLWQVLPLNPVGYGNCPYASPSAFAGNPLLISPEELVRSKFLSRSDLPSETGGAAGSVDYDRVSRVKSGLLELVREKFAAHPSGSEEAAFRDFCRKEAYWLDDYSLFIALKNKFGGSPWYEWPKPFSSRRSDALIRARRELKVRIEIEALSQYLFFRQWRGLRDYAASRGVSIIGDIPFFVNHDSADVWVNRRLFLVDARGRRRALSGVPPSDVTGTSQIWGSPLYDWKVMSRDGYRWWTTRLRAALEMVDIIRVDHFSGFYACWHIPPDADNSARGKWVRGPGRSFFRTVGKKLGPLPMIAESMEPALAGRVQEMLDDLGIPGIRCPQHGFYGGKNNPHMPEDYTQNCAVYTGSHDDNPLLGWYDNLDGKLKRKVRDYLGVRRRAGVPRSMIRLVESSPADTAIIQFQDILELGSESRMNIPGTPSGQWEWRCLPGQILPEQARRLARLTRSRGR